MGTTTTETEEAVLVLVHNRLSDFSPPLSLSLSLSFLVDEGGKLGIGFGNGKGGLSRCFSGLLMQSLQLLALLGTTAQVVHVGAPFVVVVRCCQPASGLLDCWWAGWSVQPRGCSIGVRRVCVCVCECEQQRIRKHCGRNRPNSRSVVLVILLLCHHHRLRPTPRRAAFEAEKDGLAVLLPTFERI